jgi:hypothetical protein
VDRNSCVAGFGLIRRGKMEDALTNGVESAELVKLVPAQNQARFYRLALWPDLFG